MSKPNKTQLAAEASPGPRTVTLSDEDFRLAVEIAGRRGLTVDAVVGELVRKESWGSEDRPVAKGVPDTTKGQGVVAPAIPALEGERAARVVIKEGGRGGVPILERTRIAVHDVVAYSRVYGENPQQIREKALPDLSIDAIGAALSYYRENTVTIDGILREQEEAYRRLLETSSRGS
jgi:uncharacterized protein (DUF433 family)